MVQGNPLDTATRVGAQASTEQLDTILVLRHSKLGRSQRTRSMRAATTRRRRGCSGRSGATAAGAPSAAAPSCWIPPAVKPARPCGREALALLSTVEKVLFLKSIELFSQIPGEDLARVALIASEEAREGGEEIFA